MARNPVHTFINVVSILVAVVFVLLIPVFLATVWGIAGAIGSTIFDYVVSCFNPHGCP